MLNWRQCKRLCVFPRRTSCRRLRTWRKRSHSARGPIRKKSIHATQNQSAVQRRAESANMASRRPVEGRPVLSPTPRSTEGHRWVLVKARAFRSCITTPSCEGWVPRLVQLLASTIRVSFFLKKWLKSMKLLGLTSYFYASVCSRLAHLRWNLEFLILFPSVPTVPLNWTSLLPSFFCRIYENEK